MKLLNQSHVLFNADEHTYTATDGTQLSGITSIIQSMIFPDMYKDVPKSVLEKAALRGTQIHREVELYHEIGMMAENASNELTEYVSYITQNSVNVIANEYLVDAYDLGVATAIDMVWDAPEDGYVDLADIKTTAVSNMEYLRWQLSICALLFERQNPHLKVRNMYEVHLRNGCKVTPVNRIVDEHVINMLTAWKAGEEYDNPLHHLPEEMKGLLELYAGYEEEAFEVREALKCLEDREAEIREKLIAAMHDQQLRVFKDETFNIALREGTTRESFDFKTYKKDHSDIDFSKYIKKTDIKPTVVIKLS